MNNENSSKQVLLSIIGIAILVVAVVGVSFAFFNYSKVGEENNVVTTGNIFFNFTEGESIILRNQFPMIDSKGMALLVSGNQSLKFDIVGWDSSTKGISYDVYVVKGDLPGDSYKKSNTTSVYGDGDRLDDDDIKVYLTGTSDALSSEITFQQNVNTTPLNIGKGRGESGDLGTDVAGGLKLASGHIKGETSNTAKQKDSYVLRMWIDGGVTDGDGTGVQIVDSDASKPGEVATNVHSKGNKKYSSAEFADKFYTLKVLIDAKTSTGA